MAIQRGRPADARHRDRELRGCLLARRSHGLVFIDGSMSEDERQFAVGHEFGHFFAHYLEPRRKALIRFGEAILPVLDGERPATTEERLSSILQGVPFGTFEDLLGRGGEGIRAENVQAVETEADLLALELLAPRNEVEKRLRPGSARVAGLCKEFGLPRWAAEKWDVYSEPIGPESRPAYQQHDDGGQKKFLRPGRISQARENSYESPYRSGSR